jgi:predicted Zn-dependent protease
VARLSAQASAEAGSNPLLALSLIARCRALQPDEPSHVLAEARALDRLDRTAEAMRLLDEQLERYKDEPALFADAALSRVQLAVEAHDDATARRLLEALVEKNVSPAVDRTARVRLAALSLPPAARAAVDAYFGAGDEAVQLYRLREALAAVPGEPHLAYLLGRRLAQARQSADALVWLDVASAGALPETLARETARLTVEAAYGAHDCARIEALAADTRLGPAFAARAADWLERCRFDSR